MKSVLEHFNVASCLTAWTRTSCAAAQSVRCSRSARRTALLLIVSSPGQIDKQSKTWEIDKQPKNFKLKPAGFSVNLNLKITDHYTKKNGKFITFNLSPTSFTAFSWCSRGTHERRWKNFNEDKHSQRDIDRDRASTWDLLSNQPKESQKHCINPDWGVPFLDDSSLCMYTWLI